jgi:hypothetical protein
MMTQNYKLRNNKWDSTVMQKGNKQAASCTSKSCYNLKSKCMDVQRSFRVTSEGVLLLHLLFQNICLTEQEIMGKLSVPPHNFLSDTAMSHGHKMCPSPVLSHNTERKEKQLINSFLTNYKKWESNIARTSEDDNITPNLPSIEEARRHKP